MEFKYNPQERLDYLDDRCYPNSKWTENEYDALRAWKLEKIRADILEQENIKLKQKDKNND